MLEVLRTVVRTLGELMITAGLLLLLFVAWQLWWTDVEANRAQSAITDGLHEDWQEVPAPREPTPEPPVPVDYGPPPEVPGPTEGEAFAIVHVPRFGAGFQPRPVVEGTSLRLLEDGVGHYARTALPGQVGNVALAGHRVTYGRPFHRIAELAPGDAVVLETADAWYTYRMRSSTIVTPDRVDVVEPVPEQPGAEPTERLLTLTACHPMYSARQRYVVYAVLESWQPRSAGPPASLDPPAGVAAGAPGRPTVTTAAERG
ncbi:MAG TPA: class E sortase [Mycobacteriales bacterium]|nr:class E sortase [Mycobacteriales bacterium]